MEWGSCVDIQGNVIQEPEQSVQRPWGTYVVDVFKQQGRGQCDLSGVSSGERNWRKSSEKPLELGLYSNKVTIEAYSARYIICPFQLNDSMLFKVNLPNGATITLNLRAFSSPQYELLCSFTVNPRFRLPPLQATNYLLSAVIIASPFLKVPYKWHLFCLASFTEYSGFFLLFVCFCWDLPMS